MSIPRHIAIIMDGNGRWAKQRALPRTMGHKQGAAQVKKIVRAAKENGVEALTIFAFSTENWNRPKEEVDFLFKLLNDFLKGYEKELVQEDIKLKIIGRRDRLTENIKNQIEKLERLTGKNKSLVFNIALDFGGRWDILNAVRKIIEVCQQTNKYDGSLDEKTLHQYFSLAGVPDVDLLIRTSGEQRISNFLLWELAYSELYFCDLCWPDFDNHHFKQAIEFYQQRERRFGGI